jgi:chemotaxis protein methyltransferase CheR
MGLRDSDINSSVKRLASASVKTEQKLDLAFLADFLRRKIGMDLGEDKRYLVESRLGPIATREKMAGVSALIDLLKREPGHPLVEDVIDAMTTHETLFFRDKEPFEYLKRTLLPELLKARKARRTLRIWSAACSTGQEPYSLMMLLDEIIGANRELGSFKDWKIEIIATDISRATLRRAEAGIYSTFEVARGLPEALKARWFRPLADGGWQFKDELRKRVSFKIQNLTDSPAELGTFDLVLCRNVLIYFGLEDKRKILGRLAGALTMDGRLMLGGAETVLGITQEFKREPGTSVAVYRKS